jgi:PhnB protein
MPVQYKPDGYGTVTPYLLVNDVASLIDFLVKAFDAKENDRSEGQDGAILHADLTIGDSHIMMGQASDEWKSTSTMLYLYVEDCDAVYKKAVDAGAKSFREPKTEFYGDRSAGVLDAFGNQWWMATHVEDVSEEEMQKRMKEAYG